MRRLVHFVITVGVVFGIVGIERGAAQESANPGLSLSVVFVGAKDYAESMQFYTKVMGFRPAFSFGTAAKITYLQASRDTFLSVMEGPATGPGLNHIHMHTEDVDAILARLRGVGIAPCDETLTTNCITGSRINAPTHEKGATIVDPSGIKIEPTQFLPESLTIKAMDSWDNQRPSVKLLVVGIAVKNFRESETFYEQKLGFRVAFKLSSPDGKPTSIYYYVSRDSFLEMQPATPEMPPGLTHVHMLTDDLDATVARLRKAGLASGARNAMTPNTMTEVGVAGNMKNASVFDPNGVRLELDELLPGSLLKKAMESWK